MDIELNGGDEIRQPFKITLNGATADLTECVISAKIFTLPTAIVLTEGSGITITDRVGSSGTHGLLVLSEEDSMKIAFGRSTRLRFIVVNDFDITMSTTDLFFKRIG